MKKKEKQKIKEKKEKKRRVDAWDWELSHLGPTVQNGFQPGPDSKGMESNPVWSGVFGVRSGFGYFWFPPRRYDLRQLFSVHVPVILPSFDVHSRSFSDPYFAR